MISWSKKMAKKLGYKIFRKSGTLHKDKNLRIIGIKKGED